MSVLSETLERLGTSLGREVLEERIERVVARPDASVIVTVAGEAGPRCFHGTQGQVHELTLAEDRLPAREVVAQGAGRILSWRPGRRVTWTTVDASDLVFKGYRKSRFGRALARLERVQGPARDEASLQPPRLWARDEARASYAMERLDGAPPGIGTGDTDVWAKIGAGLRAMQHDLATSGLDLHDAQAELGVLDGLAARVEAVTGGLPRGWTSTRAELSALCPDTHMVAAHRDLHDGQLVVGERRVGILDFDLLCRADSALDLGNLTAHMQLRALQGLGHASQDGADACARALLEGYGAADQDRLRAALRFYQGTTFLRLALVYRLRPRWAHVIDTLTALAGRCVEDQVRG